MTLIAFLLLLVVLGFIAYLVENYLPLSQPFKLVFHFVIVLFLIIALLQMLGFVTPLASLRLR